MSILGNILGKIFRRKPEVVTPTSAPAQPARTTAATPADDRSTLSPGLVHVRGGKFQRAQQAVSSESRDLTNLSGTRLGLAVVGRLAHKHNLSVSFRPSAHGGTGVLLMIPQTLITQAKREPRASAVWPPPRANMPIQ